MVAAISLDGSAPWSCFSGRITAVVTRFLDNSSTLQSGTEYISQCRAEAYRTNKETGSPKTGDPIKETKQGKNPSQEVPN